MYAGPNERGFHRSKKSGWGYEGAPGGSASAGCCDCNFHPHFAVRVFQAVLVFSLEVDCCVSASPVPPIAWLVSVSGVPPVLDAAPSADSSCSIAVEAQQRMRVSIQCTRKQLSALG